MVAFGNQLAWSDTLGGALDGLFGGSSGAVAGDAGSGGGTTTPPPPPAAGGGTPAQQSAALKAALADVQKAFADGQEALKKGDWTAYGEAQKRLQAAVQDADRRAAHRFGDRPGALGYGDPVPDPHEVGGGGPPPAGRRLPGGLPPGLPVGVPDRVGARRGLRASLALLLVAVAVMVAANAVGGRVVPALGMLAAGGLLGAAVAIREALRAREREEQEGLGPRAEGALRVRPLRGPDLALAGGSRSVGFTDAGWSSSVARRAHNPEVAGSNPAPATNASRNDFGPHILWGPKCVLPTSSATSGLCRLCRRDGVLCTPGEPGRTWCAPGRTAAAKPSWTGRELGRTGATRAPLELASSRMAARERGAVFMTSTHPRRRRPAIGDPARTTSASW